MATDSFRSFTLGCLLGLVTSLVLTTACDAQILYDNFQDDLDPFSYELVIGGELNWVDEGLNFVSSSARGVAISTDEGELPEADAWSFRARFTINRLIGLGLAGVGMENPQRWVAVLSASHDEEFAVGQNFRPDKVKISDGEIFGEPFVVQMDYFRESLTGRFWRPDSPTDITTILYSQ